MADKSGQHHLKALLLALLIAVALFVLVFAMAKYFPLSAFLQAVVAAAVTFVPMFLVARAFVSASSSRKQATEMNSGLFRENNEIKTANTSLAEKNQTLADECRLATEQKDYFQKCINLAGTFIVVINPDLTISLANRRACQILSSGESEIIGRNWIENFVPEPVRDEANAHLGKLLASEPGAEREWTGMVLNRDGIERIIKWRNTVLRSDGRVIGILSIGEDITETIQNNAQSQQISEKNARSGRINSISSFAGGIARLFTDTLNLVNQKTGALLQDLDTPAQEQNSGDMRANVVAIADAVAESKNVVYNLSMIARQESGAVPLSLNDVVKSFMDSPSFLEMQHSSPNIEFNTELAPDLLAMTGSMEQLVHALENLGAYAIRTMPEGGQVTIATANFYAGEDVVKYEVIPSGEYAVLWVVISKKGFTENQMENLFEPFYGNTGRDQADKNELLLPTVFGIVKAHKGYVHVKADAGETGVEFVLCFPVARREAEITQPAEGLPGGTESILVVDDNEMQRSLARRLLGKLGYKVSVAVNGRHALEQMGSGGASPFDIMLLDMVMEEDFDGLDTYREITKRFPRQKCIIVSGYAQSERSQEAGHLGAGKFLAKPYTLDSLAYAVRSELDRI